MEEDGVFFFCFPILPVEIRFVGLWRERRGVVRLVRFWRGDSRGEDLDIVDSALCIDSRVDTNLEG